MARVRRPGLTSQQIAEVVAMKRRRRDLRAQLSAWGPETVWPRRVYLKAQQIRHELVELSNIGIAVKMKADQYQISLIPCDDIEPTAAKRVPVGI